MAQPIKRRTKKEFRRSIEFLTRLRTSLLLDSRIKNSDEIVQHIDAVVTELRPLMITLEDPLF